MLPGAFVDWRACFISPNEDWVVFADDKAGLAVWHVPHDPIVNVARYNMNSIHAVVVPDLLSAVLSIITWISPPLPVRWVTDIGRISTVCASLSNHSCIILLVKVEPCSVIYANHFMVVVAWNVSISFSCPVVLRMYSCHNVGHRYCHGFIWCAAICHLIHDALLVDLRVGPPVIKTHLVISHDVCPAWVKQPIEKVLGDQVGGLLTCWRCAKSAVCWRGDYSHVHES